MNLFVYKCRNNPDTENNAYGDWTDVFAKPWKKQPWGGAWATRKPDGKEIFDNEIRTGDLILAWQSDKSAALGLCRVTGRKKSQYGGTDLVLMAVEVFDPPVRLGALKKTTHPKLADVPALKSGNFSTIYRTTAAEARLLLAACGAKIKRP